MDGVSSQCTGKIRFADKKEAEQVARHMSRHSRQCKRGNQEHEE